MENNPIVWRADKKTISELFRYGPANISITLAYSSEYYRSPLLSPRIKDYASNVDSCRGDKDASVPGNA